MTIQIGSSRNVPRVFKKAVQQGRSERRGEAYSGPYVEPLSDARTPLADFFNILLWRGQLKLRWRRWKLRCFHGDFNLRFEYTAV
jgi:hypothetical protein